jgi:riboflavin biosynthesis pyrimidine reductase
MGSTVDGRIIGEHWGKNWDKYGKLYEQSHNTFDSQAWMVGRVTMEKDFTEGRQPALDTLKKPIDHKPFIGDRNATSFAIAVDAKGKLGWESNKIDDGHVIEILSDAASDAYLQYLQSLNVSYIFAGKNDLDFKVALEQLHELFGIKTLMLEGGGNINGSLLRAGLIDELSLLVLPLADGTAGTPTTFEITQQVDKNTARSLKLVEVKKLDYDVVWLRYTFI